MFYLLFCFIDAAFNILFTSSWSFVRSVLFILSNLLSILVAYSDVFIFCFNLCFAHVFHSHHYVSLTSSILIYSFFSSLCSQFPLSPLRRSFHSYRLVISRFLFYLCHCFALFHQQRSLITLQLPSFPSLIKGFKIASECPSNNTLHVHGCGSGLLFTHVPLISFSLLLLLLFWCDSFFVTDFLPFLTFNLISFYFWNCFSALFYSFDLFLFL